MKKKISIITSFSISTPHPRVEMEKKVLCDAGFEVKVFSFPVKPGLWERGINYLSFNNFKKHLFKDVINCVSDEDLIILYDYALLPASKAIRGKNKKVIYESVDNMVHLNFYEIEKRLTISKLFKNFYISYYARKEKNWAAACEGIIVNSKALLDYFQPVPSSLIFYSSPFEGVSLSSDLPSEAALLYLGLLSKEKGADEMLDLQKFLGIPLYILGDIPEESLKYRVIENNQVFWKARQNSEDLADFLDHLRKKYRFLGCSIIQPIHHSYATQEANKDQDYLAMGIPIIGNLRKPTYEKIQAGCGILFTEYDKIQAIIKNIELYKSYRATCLEYYQNNYSYQKFRDALLQLVDRCLGQDI